MWRQCAWVWVGGCGYVCGHVSMFVCVCVFLVADLFLVLTVRESKSCITRQDVDSNSFIHTTNDGQCLIEMATRFL